MRRESLTTISGPPLTTVNQFALLDSKSRLPLKERLYCWALRISEKGETIRVDWSARNQRPHTTQSSPAGSRLSRWRISLSV